MFRDPVVIMKEIMSWLFKDPINSDLLNLTLPNQPVKNSLKAKKIKLPPNDFFSRKTPNKSFMYLLTPLCKILKKFLWPMQSYDDVPCSGTKWPICHEQIFLVQTIIITFIYLMALFAVQNLKKFLQWIQSYEDAPFLDPKWSICPNQFFFGKLLISFSSTY